MFITSSNLFCALLSDPSNKPIKLYPGYALTWKNNNKQPVKHKSENNTANIQWDSFKFEIQAWQNFISYKPKKEKK